MKIIKYISLAISLLILTSCEDVINVDLNTATPKLVIDAAINWQKGTDGSSQKIILSTTTDFYSNTIPKVSGAIVSIKNSENISYSFTEVPNSGEYQCANFKPIIGETYVLTVIYKNETYTATETMQSVSPIEYIQQKSDGGFSGKDYEIEVSFKDPLDKNYYMVKFFPNIYKSPSYGVIGDQYTNGNIKSWNFSDPDLEKGNTIDITHYGISLDYYNYMNKIISIASSSGGGSPFQTPPSTVRGNIVNQTNQDNYALGYFSLSEIDFRKYTLQ
jgi:hypothetical protein